MLRSSINLGGVNRRTEIKRNQVGDTGSIAKWLRVRVLEMEQESREVMDWKSMEIRCFDYLPNHRLWKSVTFSIMELLGKWFLKQEPGGGNSP